ncbi:hypothetical protein QF002_001104 [Paraburkholderia youngii]
MLFEVCCDYGAPIRSLNGVTARNQREKTDAGTCRVSARGRRNAEASVSGGQSNRRHSARGSDQGEPRSSKDLLPSERRTGILAWSCARTQLLAGRDSGQEGKKRGAADVPAPLPAVTAPAGLNTGRGGTTR